MKLEIANIRTDYTQKSLSEKEVLPNPINQFTIWWNEAIKSEITEVNAMTLCTANAAAKPTSRIVLLKEFNENGFVFFTNYNSDKGQQIAVNNQVSLVFFWKELERQVCIEGNAFRIDEKESDAYFESRPTGSKIGAWSSNQSKEIDSRETLENNFKLLEQQFNNSNNIPRPSNWGGYIVKPTVIEFWQGRGSRLHDRIYYELQENNSWKISRLQP